MTPEEGFWKWFIEQEGKLFSLDTTLDADREQHFDELAIRLQNVHPDLCFEFGPKEAKREFVISAGGLRRAFPAVVSLTNAAPHLDRWRVTAFRPRQSPIHAVEFRGKQVDPEAVEFVLLDDGQNAGIYLFIPGFEEGDGDTKQLGYLLLDEALGEYDVETRLGLIKMLSPESRVDGERYPLALLPEYFDQLISKLERRPNPPLRN